MERFSSHFGPPPTTLEGALAENAALRLLVVKLEDHIERLEARVEALERRVGQNSDNSSRPPSSDMRDTPRPPKKPPTGRKPGGQPGHEGHQRKLVPPERVDETQEVRPSKCENCRHPFGRDGIPVQVGDVFRHQVIEIPQTRAHVTEFRLHTLWCAYCEHATQAALPDGVPTSDFGPRLQAFVAVCTGVFHLSKRSAVRLLGDLFGVDISAGSVIACEQRTSTVLEAPVAEAHEFVQDQLVLNADETGWFEKAKRAWLWVAVTAYVTVFKIDARRGKAAGRRLLGRFAGILGSDRWIAYADHALHRRQLCWAHLRRHFAAFAEWKGEAAELGGAALTVTDQMFQWWHRVRDGTMARTTFRRKMATFKVGFRGLLAEGAKCTHPQVAATCREILKMEPALWTFVRWTGVEPTNNAAERAIRPAVLLRKRSLGTQSDAGSRYVERMLTVAATLRQQGRNVVDYVTEACERSLRGLRPRSLLPGGHVMRPHASPLHA